MKNEIGKATCPLCKSDKAGLGLSEKSKLVYLHCGACACQIFARSDRSDAHLRKSLVGAAADPAPAPKPVADPKPAPKKDDDKKPEPVAAGGGDSWDPFNS